MAVEILTQAPSLNDFKLLSDHQQQTPGTFFGGKPVLHIFCPNAKLRARKSDTTPNYSFPILSWFNPKLPIEGNDSTEVGNGDSFTKSADVWVTSNYILAYSHAEQSGIRIDYHTVVFHGQVGNAVLLSLNLSDANTADEDIVSFDFHIQPNHVEKHDGGANTDGTQQVNGNHNAVSDLYDAITTCQELNPDRLETGEFEDDVPESTAPGTSGWITSENMHEFVGEDGEFKMPEGITVIGEDEAESNGARLGEGAGKTRSAADLDGEEDSTNEDTKWQRTS